MAITLFVSALLLMALGFPVAFALAMSAAIAVFVGGRYPQLIVFKEMFTGIDSFPLMAVPFFILAAEIMSGGALTVVLLRFAAQFVGHLRGGLGHANILSLTLFSGISGSALADAAGPGSMMVKMMDKAGYSRAYAAALTASTAIVGPIIPPSIIMIIYALQDEQVSVGALFIAGFAPGILIAVAMAIVNWRVCVQRDYRSREPRPGGREMLANSIRAIPALMLVVLILVGIRFGIFTPTEASVVAVFYALVCGKWIYRTLEWKALPHIAARSALLTASVLLVVAASAAFAWVLTVEGVPQRLAETIVGWNLSPVTFLIAVNILLLLFGIFMEPLPGVMILVPILAPISAALGIDPIHFAMVVIVNLTLGMITPPVGGLLFVTSVATKVPLAALTRELPPFLVAHLIVLGLLTFVPAISTWLPHALGF
ncbi:TRAP transporter large permease [Paracidovorax citrulli]|uniref:TRAP transporter large permease protein n=2 Tax=Paracidovorax citrulli TaxID=80869 RepID=A1TSR4_PARC0|nr:TRAP transporter large permease [Paracidovorax citrulli]ABM34002.1 TRAP dicarboxylate transporter, DctM subunit [Paracidovorax citrulli AAC00-1]ATG93524.1 TRAP transporter large permease [Paracidovorax citrulli]MVT27855.1 TRAP transporter large permease subunit [Paracidovorax citrulli]MVT37009.1 TRAP transporter large permease subunit [Paracidovorax citrulli]PVY63439.1 tripartite ATP-independent transporter DctM subunit [Paracidovorax citrulli]